MAAKTGKGLWENAVLGPRGFKGMIRRSGPSGKMAVVAVLDLEAIRHQRGECGDTLTAQRRPDLLKPRYLYFSRPSFYFQNPPGRAHHTCVAQVGTSFRFRQATRSCNFTKYADASFLHLLEEKQGKAGGKKLLRSSKSPQTQAPPVPCPVQEEGGVGGRGPIRLDKWGVSRRNHQGRKGGLDWSLGEERGTGLRVGSQRRTTGRRGHVACFALQGQYREGQNGKAQSRRNEHMELLTG